LGYLAARTRSIRLATNVLVLGYHHPLELAKQYGTLDVVSNGRVILGVGVGTLKEEFDLLEAPFEDRGARGNDAIRALRAALSKREPTYRGEYYSFGDLVVEPCAVQEKLPIWVGGRTLRSLRRAVDLADGWCPFGTTVEQAQEWLGRVNIPAGFEVVLRPDDLFDPIAKPQVTADALGRLATVGTTIAVAQVVHQSLEHYLEQLDALTAINART
jgi:probable F420-dependent oxidoreductase